MNSVNKTLYIPLYGKAYVSKKGIILRDKKAEEIREKEHFPLKGKAKSKWLAYYMGMRSAVMDDWVRKQMIHWSDAVIIHIGCGMDSRVLRVGTMGHKWYDVDFVEVIRERKRYYAENADYRMIAGDVRTNSWLEHITEKKTAIVVMEGVSMYMTTPELRDVIVRLSNHFEQISFMMDCYTVLAAKLSKYKNPINEVGVTEVHGIDDPRVFERDGFTFVKEHDLTPETFIEELNGLEKIVFRNVFAGKLSKKLYRLFEYRSE